ncbi:hypothetical protein D3C73_934400 [compost metagenome]
MLQTVNCAIIITATITNPVASAVERRKRHQHDLGVEFGRVQPRPDRAEDTRDKLGAGCQFAKNDGFLVEYNGHTNPRPALSQEIHKRTDIHLGADRQEAGHERSVVEIDRRHAMRCQRQAFLHALRSTERIARREPFGPQRRLDRSAGHQALSPERETSSLSIRRPSRSTTSKVQPCVVKLSPSSGRCFNSSSTKPATVS